MFNMNSGYNGYSMSNRAVEAYDNGEKPLSKWTKAAIIDEVKDNIDENNTPFTMAVLEKAPKAVLVDLLLRRSSWHHTSSYCNSTDFYSVDIDLLKQLTNEAIKESVESHKTTTCKKEPVVNKYKGIIRYLEWSGTRNHPKATEMELKDVNIEEKGCFYIVTDDKGSQLLKKKIGSNGTYVTRL